MSFPEQLAALRKERALTQQQMAEDWHARLAAQALRIGLVAVHHQDFVMQVLETVLQQAVR